MPNIRYGFGRQVQLLCQNLCYVAFGINPYLKNINNMKSDIQIEIDDNKKTLEQFQMAYKCDISRRVYDYHMGKQFRYIEQGITPKAIAHEIQVHMRALGDLQWHIDQFGNFVFLPTQKYLSRIGHQLIDQKTFFHQPLLQLSQLSPIPQQTHYFDYIINPDPSIKEFRSLMYMEAKAKVLEQINGHSVVRSVFLQGQGIGTLDKAKEIVNLVFGQDKYELYEYKDIFKQSRSLKIANSNRRPKVYQYVNCNPQNTISIAKPLPGHQTICPFVGNQQKPASKYPLLELVNKLNTKHKGYYNKYKQVQDQLMKQPKSTQQCIIIFGNLIDKHQFELIEILIRCMKRWGTGAQGQLGVFIHIYDSLCKLKLQQKIYK